MKRILTKVWRKLRPVSVAHVAEVDAARVLVHERLQHFNRHYGFPYGRVAIRNQSTKWGSCSSLRNLNFNYRIIQLPPHLQDYLVVHELCHLGQMNHSKAFWDLVAQTIPDWSVCRQELRRVPMSHPR